MGERIIHGEVREGEGFGYTRETVGGLGVRQVAMGRVTFEIGGRRKGE
jgi:hypothetical protein